MSLAALVALALLRRFDPNHPGNPFFACNFHAVTGLWCPGCGATRALHALAHGDPLRALSMNALVVALIPLAIGTLFWLYGWRPTWMRKVAAPLARPWLWIAALPGFWLARNLPWPPFNWLAPG
ncbi:DUF2752 domain-containing protein [Lysobacter pythonis]|uniref:DUF2752 domain-containing protein n=1 Tax=Solilutibacter pythonis TaxID=2483112 RepID=A0A3M2HZ32_9GAMM|nr:DUF2752 domain-containing protein [Lysobacter pythonis]RMH92910.1 DUF2752 domain-containing protein [Lysobacter pythonis]